MAHRFDERRRSAHALRIDAYCDKALGMIATPASNQSMERIPRPRDRSSYSRYADYDMRSSLVLFLSLVVALSGHAAEIREFDIKTTERLGRELAQEANRPGHLTDKQRRARDTATAALKGRLFDIHYDYVVLNDPEHLGFLVYAL